MLAALTIFALTFAAASFGARFRPGQWYAGLAKPPWNPPNWIFAPVWTVLYIGIAVAALLVFRRTHVVGTPLLLWGAQLALNALWSWLFFGLQRPGLAFGEIVCMLVAVVATVIAFLTVDRTAGLILVPYAAWVAFATALNFAIWRLNSR
jgi:translocator protein